MVKRGVDNWQQFQEISGRQIRSKPLNFESTRLGYFGRQCFDHHTNLIRNIRQIGN